MSRGAVLGLTLDQVAARARQLGDPAFVAGYYLLSEHNGGKDPSAADPFDRWSKDGSSFINRTADCIGGASWCGGFDRYQPERFAHLYDGWINTDSMLLDATGPAKCFVELAVPVPGCFLVAPTGAPGFEHCGHITTIVTVPDGWTIDDEAAWHKLLGTDVAARGALRANTTHDAMWWFAARHHGARFVRSVMTP